MRIIILGANGQIGKIIFDATRKNFPGATILGCVRAKHLHFEGVDGNRQQHSVIFDPFQNDWSALGKPDWIINCIGAIDETGMNFERVHLQPLFHFEDQFESLGKPKLIQVSALEAKPDSPSAFLRTKSLAEKTALHFPGSYVIRPSIVCTPGTMMVQRLRGLKKLSRIFGGKMFFPEQALQTEIQPVSPDDLAALIIQLIKKGSSERIIDLTGAEKFSMNELLQMAEIKPVSIRKTYADLFFKIFRPFLKRLISPEQYRLLGLSNTGEHSLAEEIIGRKMRSTKAYWEKELGAEKTERKNSAVLIAG